MSISSKVLMYNQEAMQHLHKNSFAECLHFLHRAQDLLGSSLLPNQKLLAITLNNLGFYYKRVGNLPMSVHFLSQALDLKVLSVEDRINLAGTNLNMCAVQSSLKQHEKALSHAEHAIEILEKEGSKETLVIAYHNAGIEYEYLKKYGEARLFYEKALELAKSVLGSQHQVTNEIFRSFSQLNNRKRLPTIRRTNLKSVINHRSFRRVNRVVKSHREYSRFRSFARYNIGRKIVTEKETFNSIQDKIIGLQEHLNEFEKKYKEIMPIVNIECAKSNDIGHCARLIQACFRQFFAYTKFQQLKRTALNDRAKQAILDIESLKIEMEKENGKLALDIIPELSNEH